MKITLTCIGITLELLAQIRYGFNLGFGKGEQYRKHGRSRVENNGGSIPPLITQLRGIDAPDIAMLKVQSRCKTS